MARELFPSYLYPTNTWRHLKTPDLRTSTLIGYMKSGKTVTARYIGGEAFEEITRRGYDDSEFIFIEARSLRQAKRWVSENLDDKVKFTMIFVDDAIGHAHSRQKNVEETSLYTDVRHWTIRRGLISILYATQNFRLLDSVMRYAQVYIWKTLPLEYYLEKDAKKWVLRYIGLPEMVKMLERITSMVYSTDPTEMLEGLRKAVVRIPMKKYGPKMFDGIPAKRPPRSRWVQVWRELGEEEDKGQGDTYNNININNVKALARAVLKLARTNGYHIRVYKGKYLRVRRKVDGKNEEYSLGPIAQLLEDLGVNWRTRS